MPPKNQDTTCCYVLVTPARNEEAQIESVLQAVTAQTVLPRRYVIVSDGSTDRTDEIVEEYARRHDFIELVRFEKGKRGSFGSKALAFSAGYARLKTLDYDFVGNLDADISFDPNYFETILEEFKKDAQLGLAGGWVYVPVKGEYRPQMISDNSVAGAVQLFRRECFAAIGGYLPLKRGGIDTAAEITARMRGWKVRTIRSCKVLTHRPVRTGRGGVLATRFNKGVMNYEFGYHPLFQLAVSVRSIFSYPVFMGTFWMLGGYTWAMLKRHPRQVSDEFVAFLREEQLRRLCLRRAKTARKP